jgi:hypothetical protein
VKKSILIIAIVVVIVSVAGCKCPFVKKQDVAPAAETIVEQEADTQYLSESERVEAEFGEGPDSELPPKEYGTLNEPESIPEGAIVEKLEETTPTTMEQTDQQIKEEKKAADFDTFKKIEDTTYQEHKENKKKEPDASNFIRNERENANNTNSKNAKAAKKFGK